jgi:hypothetical protein
MAGIVLTAGIGEVMRELRRRRAAPGERMAPKRSILGQRLRG